MATIQDSGDLNQNGRPKKDVSEVSPKVEARSIRELPQNFEGIEKSSQHIPNEPPKQPQWGEHSVFLAGSIEMGDAIPWQTNFTRFMAQYPVTTLNPRSGYWDFDCDEEKKQANFLAQVDWELNALDKVDVIAMYFDPQTKSPVTMLELGLYAQTGRLLVCCPAGFWRHGNVKFVCDRYKVPMFHDYCEFFDAVVEKLKVGKMVEKMVEKNGKTVQEAEWKGMPTTGNEVKPEFSAEQKTFFQSKAYKESRWDRIIEPTAEDLRPFNQTPIP